MVNALSLMPSASILSLALGMDMPGIIICLMLFGGSIYVWSIMLSKLVSLKNALHDSRAFLRQYRALKHPAELFLDPENQMQQAPLQAVYKQACIAFEAVLDVQGLEAEALYEEGELSQIHLSDRHISSIQNAAERTVADQALLLESSIGYLASAANMAPFLGLLGTVLGVMVAFGSMAGTGTALLSEVAPGIASALMTTAVGLLVALPSAIGYNVLSDRVRQLTVMMDNFSQELVGDLERVHAS